MARKIAAILIAIVFALLLVLLAAVVTPFVTPERVYTVAEVQAGLARQPRAWLGRTILVRGQFVYWEGFGSGSGEAIMSVPDWHVRRARLGSPWIPPLSVTLAPGVSGHVPVTWSTLMAFGWEMAARLPVVGPMIPDALADEGIIYRVRLLPRACATFKLACTQGVLLKVAP